MTKARAQVVNRKSLAEIGRSLGIQDVVVVGKMFATRDAIAASVLSDATEAVLAAVYLDGGLAAAREFVERHFRHAGDKASAAPGARDLKSLLRQWAQANAKPTPIYPVLSTAGEDHARTFEVSAQLGNRRFAASYGRSKKEAEQRAAHAALRELGLV